MKLIVKHSHEVSHEESMNAGRHHVDSVLCKDLIQFRANHDTAVMWLESRRAYAKLVLPVDVTDKCLVEGVKAVTIMPQLKSLVDPHSLAGCLVPRL